MVVCSVSKIKGRMCKTTPLPTHKGTVVNGNGREPQQAGKELDSLAEVVALQESSARSELDYAGLVKKRRLGQKT
ncbi:hypothetical protein CR513_20018, partial [Mucuna pruriens]